MARHTAKSHKIRKVEILVIQIVIESLETALASLIETKNFSEISISELVKKAGIARSTFHRNYECKEDIIRFSIRRTLNEFSMQ